MKAPGSSGARQRRAKTLGEDDAQGLAEAKLVARYLMTELAKVDCSLAVMGTALAMLLGAVALQVRFEAREDFYQDFLLAARESVAECERFYASFAVTH
jgi:hypothetical protein